MPIREARLSDHYAMAVVFGKAFFNEDLFGRVIHPHRNIYPDDVTLYWLRRIREHWFDWRNCFLVVVTKDCDGKEAIVGVAEWTRQGAGSKVMELSMLDPRNLGRPLFMASNRISAYIWPNRAADPAKTDILERAIPYSKHHWSGSRADNWYLDALAVHPDYQGKGYGKSLVMWGIRKADEENVHASVMSSAGNETFYLRCGFEEIVGWATEGEENPLAGVAGGAILFRAPRKATAGLKARN